MRAILFACAVLSVPAPLLAQMPSATVAPKQLPPTLSQSAPKAVDAGLNQGSVTPADLPAAEAFDPSAVQLKFVEGRLLLMAGTKLLGDFGNNDRDARQAQRWLQRYQVNQRIVIAGAKPPFTLWLRDGKVPDALVEPANSPRFDPTQTEARELYGVWCLLAKGQVVFQFGGDADAARTACALVKHHGVNQIGLIGDPAVMSYLLVERERPAPAAGKEPDARQIFETLARNTLMLDGMVVGSTAALDPAKLRVTPKNRTWVVTHGTDTLHDFGAHEQAARDFVRLAAGGKVTQVARLGSAGVPLFLAGDKAPSHLPLGLQATPFDAKELKAEEIEGKWCVCDKGLIVIVCGPKKDDAEVMLQALRGLGCDQFVRLGEGREGLVFFSRALDFQRRR